MDYYSILEINKDSSQDQIKHSYRYLIKKWHPDKNKDPNATSMFKKITEAYETLSDPDKRRSYDMIGTGFDSLNQNNIGIGNIFTTFMNNDNMEDLFSDCINLSKIVNTLHKKKFGKESSFINNIFATQSPIYNFFKQNVDVNVDVEVEEENKMRKDEDGIDKDRIDDKIGVDIKKGNNLYYDLYASIEDIYKGKYKKANIKRNRNGTIVKDPFKVHLINKNVIFEGEANDEEGCERGNLIINIHAKEHSTYYRSGNYDLIIKRDISVVDIYSNELIKIVFPDGSQDLCMYSKDLIIKGKGFLYEDGMNRGNCYVEFNVEFPELSEDRREMLLKIFDRKESH
jgi:DnaJ family protein B protein 4